MWRMETVLLVLATIVALTSSEGYDGFKIFEVVPQTQKQIEFLHNLSKMDDLYDFFVLRNIPNHTASVMVNSKEVDNFLNALAQRNFSYKIINNDVGRMVEQEFKFNNLRRSVGPSSGKGRLRTNRYYNFTEINDYIEDLAKRFPTRVVIKPVGKSYEGRLIKTIKISNGDGRANKNVIFIDGAFHAREWISPAATLYVIAQLVENFQENADLLLDYDFLILPVVNPDGYEYSQLSPQTRLWRKTRQPFKKNQKTCYGTDPNRNFDFHWNEGGTSSNPCSEIFAGPYGFSEPETMIVRDLIHSLKGRGIMYLTLHSYGNYLIYPWGWTNDFPKTWKDLDEVAQAGGDAIFNATGIQYTIGTSGSAFYIAAGGSDDYAYYSGFKIAITMELSGGGRYGFDPPSTSIDDMVKEAWIGVRAMSKKVIKKYPTQNVQLL